MNLLALVVSSDDSASQILSRVLPVSGIAVERLSDLATALCRIRGQCFDAFIIDFEDPKSALAIFDEACRLNSGHPPITIALVPDPARVRKVLSSGAHFVLYKPLSDATAKAGLRAAVALLKRERRRAHRVTVQAPVVLTLPEGRIAEGILLDLSETGMDVLLAEPQATGALLKFTFKLPDETLEVDAQGQVAWALPNGQTGVRFLELDQATKDRLHTWVQASTVQGDGPDETVSHCKLTDLSLGGCYVESDSPFPERALVDLRLSTQEMAVHTEGMVRVMHPGFGMGVEFPSRTPEQRAQVANLISFLRSCPETAPELSVSPRALTADLTQFEEVRTTEEAHGSSSEDMQDPLLELLRQGCALQQDEFLAELRRQRSDEIVTS
jgi:DNA-binding response OmpR family regulator